MPVTQADPTSRRYAFTDPGDQPRHVLICRGQGQAMVGPGARRSEADEFGRPGHERIDQALDGRPEGVEPRNAVFFGVPEIEDELLPFAEIDGLGSRPARRGAGGWRSASSAG